MWSALLIPAVLAIATPIRAQEPHRDKADPSAYGKTPNTIIPYRHFQEPYTRFFQSVMAFRGTGRDEAPVDRPRTARIGFFGPVGSAPDADVGQQMLDGVTLAIEQANISGGYDGIPFELVVRRDSGLWGASSNEMVAFKYEDDALAVIGSVDGANTHIALRVGFKIQMPMVNTATTDPTLTETSVPWLLRCMADDRQQGYALARHIFDGCGIDSVVAIRANDRYGRTGIAEFRDAARRLKHPIRAELRWDRGDRDFTSQLDRVVEAEPEAIVLWGNASDTAAIVREIRRRGMSARVFGCDRLVSRTFLEEAGPAAEGVVAVAAYDPTRADPDLRAFTRAFTDRFGHGPETFAAHGYDGANILLDAVRKAGLNRVRIRDALFSNTHYHGVTGPIEFDNTLNDIGPVYLATVRQGRFVYRRADLAPRVRADRGRRPYRTLAQSPPLARAPRRQARVASPVYRVGCFLPLDAAGKAAVRGVEMALAEDAARHPDEEAIQLLVRDARATWGENTASLVELVFTEEVLTLIGSTGRRGTHLAEMLAAKIHFPVVALCGSDPTITAIPLPWIFCMAPTRVRVDPGFTRRYRARYGVEAEAQAALGYDAGAIVAAHIRSGIHTRLDLRNALAAHVWNHGVSGVFRFDDLGNRIDRSPPAWVRGGGR